MYDTTKVRTIDIYCDTCSSAYITIEDDHEKYHLYTCTMCKENKWDIEEDIPREILDAWNL